MKRSEVVLSRSNVLMKVWVYLPNPAPAKKVPCILIAPAGTRLFHGMDLGDGDQPEHVPYVSKGFAVVAYELDGAVSQRATERELGIAIGQFRKADSGVANAKAALDYALAKVPQIDASRIYAIGHSSAATLALQVAESDPRIAACVAFAPICNVAARLQGSAAMLERVQPGSMKYFQQVSPNNNVKNLTCPTMLFSAEDDLNVPTPLVRSFAQVLQRTNKNVKLVTVKTGGHYDSMIRQGIPAAITWLAQVPAKAN